MKQKRKKINSEIIFSYTYLAPFLIAFFLFTILPILISIFFSFTYYNVLEPPKWIFLQNYLKLFMSDDIFIIALKNTLIIAVIVGPLGYLMSLLFAWFINELGDTLRTVMVLVFYAPSISGGVYAIWAIIFSGDAFGYANSLLLYLGLIDEPIQSVIFCGQFNTCLSVSLPAPAFRFRSLNLSYPFSALWAIL